MKYPNSQKTYEKIGNHDTSRRGMSLEYDINLSSQYYLEREMANIHKKPTPITIARLSNQLIIDIFI